VPFVIIQIIMVSLVIAFPGLVTSGIDKKKVFDTGSMRIEVPAEAPPLPVAPGVDGSAGGQPARDGEQTDDDPAKAIERALRGESAPAAAPSAAEGSAIPPPLKK
jgi:hypothetical protein